MWIQKSLNSRQNNWPLLCWGSSLLSEKPFTFSPTSATLQGYVFVFVFFSCQMSKQGELLSLYLCFISFHVCEVYNVHSRHIKWRLQLFKAISYDSLATFYLCHLFQPARTKDSDCQLQNYAPITGPEFYLTRAAQYLSSLYQFNVSANFWIVDFSILSSILQCQNAY